MPMQLPNQLNTLSEPKRHEQKNGGSFHSSSGNDQDKAWLRAQLLAGKNSPLCDPISPTHFDDLRARVRQTFSRK